VRGTVRDSLFARTLGGALVQLVSDDGGTRYAQTVLSARDGLFEFVAVPEGRYVLGFHHALLDSLGLEPIARAVAVQGSRTVLADLAIPSPSRFRRAVCGEVGTDGGVLVGVVRDARGLGPVAGASVGAEWLEYSFAGTGITRRVPRREVTTTDAGWFALCDVPSPGTVVLAAARGADSTDRIEWQMPAGGFARRDLYVGTARTALSAPVAAPSDSGPPAAPRRVGDGRLRGVVVAADGERPLAAAQVTVVGGPVARTGADGGFLLADAPAGTRMLEVRAVGHYPERRVVDIIEGSPPLRVGLATLQAVMDTVRATAARLGTQSLVAFEERRRTGQGRYLTADDIRRRAPVLTSDIFRAVPGVYWDGGINPDAQIVMRGIYSERCTPTFYLNGAMINALSANDLDLFVKPTDIVGIEVYAAGTAPPEFQNYGAGDSAGAGTCGSIVLWTR
jgi:hypothetical protein